MPVWEDGDYTLGAQEEWAFKSRTFTAQILTLDQALGKMTVEVLGMRERYTVDVPVGGFSIRGTQSSWQRYMPAEKEYVDLTFTATNRPRVVGMSTYSGTQDSGAYAQVAKSGDARLRAVFRTLESGEFDLRSSGGAGYYFTNSGRAILEAGDTTLELDKSRSEVVGNAGLWVHGGLGVEVRHGDVKRLLPGTFEETSVGVLPGQLPLNPTAAGAKEWTRTVSVLSPPLGVPRLYLEQTEIGDVRDALGVPVVGAYGVPLRARQRLYGADGLIETLTVEVDAQGNTRVLLGSQATLGGLAVSGATSPLSLSFGSVAIDAQTTADVSTVGALNLNAGGTADSPMLRSNELLAYWANPSKFSVLTAFGPAAVIAAPFTPGVEVSLLAKVK